MSLALSKASRLKPELRLAQAISAFTADLSADQKARLAEKRAEALKSPPSIQDVRSLIAEIDRANSGGCYVGPRLINLVGVVQKFASLGDVIVGGSQNIIAIMVAHELEKNIVLTAKLGKMITASSSYLEKLSMVFMNVGRSAPQFEILAILYPHSRPLQSFSSLAKLGTSLSDSSLSKHQSSLESWGRTIKGEVQLLMARRVEEESQVGSKSRDKSDKFFKNALYQQQYQAKQRVLKFCSEYDYMVAWKQIRKIGNTSLFRNCPMHQIWKHTPQSRFLIYASNLGAGKSVMLANLVDDLNLQSQDSKIPVTFFFSRYDLREALSIVPGSTDWHPSRLLNDVDSTLAQCGGLVIVNEEELTICLVHHSFKQYLVGNPQDSSHVTLDVEVAQRKMAEMSITFFNYPAFENQLATSAIPEVQADLDISGIVHSTGKTMERVSSLALKILRSKNDTTFNIGKTLAEARKLHQNSENQLIFRNYAEKFWDTHLSASFPVVVKVGELLQNLVKRNLLSALSKEDAQALFVRSMMVEANYLSKYIAGAHTLEIDLNFVLGEAGATPLHKAVLQNDLEFVNLLLSKETRHRERDRKGWTSLLLAVSLASFPIFKVLLSIDIRDEFAWEVYHHVDGSSIFHLATNSGNLDIMASLLFNTKMPILSTDSAGNTPLHLAAQAGHKDIVNMIIDTVFMQMDQSTAEEMKNHLKLIEVPLNSDAWKMTVDSHLWSWQYQMDIWSWPRFFFRPEDTGQKGLQNPDIPH
ncbi:hypothetical protein N7493_011949 [Penicillium malachiteum]|uniref:Nephrocystin 3-like N-terminal domain-containing protein n=1 Tax=Penicillium malachiteum TaxID=1324776 RepID=A0AAD6MQ13_9EURO|nr:hypothetical protein N7493_011949 [Penicillium malachiteum]